MIGERIGNYRIAEGGMGAVYLAEHPAIGRRVAVKVLLPEVAGDQEVVRRFFNEARAAHSIRHPGIVEILDFGTLPSGTSYIIMEFLEGESLGARLKSQSRLSAADAVEIATQAALALAAAHTQGIVHRDLKPDNLFLVRDPRASDREIVKVLDEKRQRFVQRKMKPCTWAFANRRRAARRIRLRQPAAPVARLGTPVAA